MLPRQGKLGGARSNNRGEPTLLNPTTHYTTLGLFIFIDLFITLISFVTLILFAIIFFFFFLPLKLSLCFVILEDSLPFTLVRGTTSYGEVGLETISSEGATTSLSS